MVSGDDVYVGGGFLTIDGEPRSSLARIKADGSVDPDWNPSATNGGVFAIAVSGETLYVGGSFTAASGNTIGGQPRNRIAALQLNGHGAATSWNPNANQLVRSLAIHGSTVFAGGNYTNIGGANRTRLAALNMETGQAVTWNPGGGDEIISGLYISDSTLHVGSWFWSIGGYTSYTLIGDPSPGDILWME